MKYLFIFIIALLFVGKVEAQKIYSVDYSSQADVKVYVVEYES